MDVTVTGGCGSGRRRALAFACGSKTGESVTVSDNRLRGIRRKTSGKWESVFRLRRTIRLMRRSVNQKRGSGCVRLRRQSAGEGKRRHKTANRSINDEKSMFWVPIHTVILEIENEGTAPDWVQNTRLVVGKGGRRLSGSGRWMRAGAAVDRHLSEYLCLR